MNGYTKIPNELMRNQLLSPTEKTVWGVIAGMAPGFNPTIGQLCKMVQCHRDTWRAAVKWLQRFGMVTVEHRPNGVTYTVVEDTSKWHITPREGMKNSHPMKISEGMKISTPEGMKKPTPEGMKISTPSEEQIEEQKKTIAAARARAREESIILGLKIYDQWSEAICMKHHIDPTQWSETVDAFVLDMRCRNQDLTVITDIRAYFNGWINKREQNGTNQQSGQPSDPRAKLDADAVKAMAALAAESRRPKVVPF